MTVLACLAASSALPGASAAVAVDIRTARDEAGMKAEVQFSPGPDGTRYLEVTLHNTSARELAVTAVNIELPWGNTLPAHALVAAGGSVMFDAPTTIHRGDAISVQSGALLLSRHEQVHELVGFLSWRMFRSLLVRGDGRTLVVADGEGRVVAAGEKIRLDRLWLGSGPSWQDLLFTYAREVARENRIELQPRRAFVGWSNWDYYGGRFNTRQLLDNLEALQSMNIGANLFQIDGGWWKHQGDYTDSNDRLPDGVEAIAAKVRDAGMVAGIHLDGARASPASDVVRTHPDYFLHTADGTLIRSGPPDRPLQGNVYFDFTHPGAREHLKRVARLQRDRGFDYFKVDFLKFAFPYWAKREAKIPAHAPVVRYDPRLTSLEAFHLAMKAMREGMGDDAYFLACTADFGTILGHVDALRSGGDIDPTFSRFSRSVMENGGVFYLNGTVVWNDADYIVVRSREDEDASLTPNPRKTGGDMPESLALMWTHYVGLFGGPRLSGDNLTILRERRKQIFKESLALPGCERFVPLDFWQRGRHRDDPFHVFLGESGGTAYLAIFNWSDSRQEYRLSGWTAEPDITLLSGTAGIRHDSTSGLNIEVESRHSAVFRLGHATFDAVRSTLQVHN